MLTVPFILGEDRLLTFQITSRDGRPFAILAADWRLERDGELLLEGAGQIDGANDTIAVQVKPPQKGRLNLEIRYLIGTETLIERVELSVC